MVNYAKPSIEIYNIKQNVHDSSIEEYIDQPKMDQHLEQETFDEEGLAYEQVGIELKTLGIKKEVNKILWF